MKRLSILICVLCLAAVSQATITVTNLTSGGSSTCNNTGFVTASVTPTSGDLLLLLVAQNWGASNGPTQPSLTGTNGLSGTWTLISDGTHSASQVFGATQGTGKARRVAVFATIATSSVAGTVSGTTPENTTAETCSWGIDDIGASNATTGNLTNGGAFPQIVVAAQNTAGATIPQITMGTYASASNGTWGGASMSTTPTLTGGTCCTRTIHTTVGAGSAIAEFNTGNVTGANALTYGFTTTSVWGMAGLEVAIKSTVTKVRKRASWY